MTVLNRDDHEAAARLDRKPEPVPASLRYSLHARHRSACRLAHGKSRGSSGTIAA